MSSEMSHPFFKDILTLTEPADKAEVTGYAKVAKFAEKFINGKISNYLLILSSVHDRDMIFSMRDNLCPCFLLNQSLLAPIWRRSGRDQNAGYNHVPLRGTKIEADGSSLQTK